MSVVTTVLSTLMEKLQESMLKTLGNDRTFLKKFYSEMYSNFSPDITGYTFLLMDPPEFSGWMLGGELTENIEDILIEKIKTKCVFLATDFNPPTNQVNSESVSTKSGAIMYANDVISSESFTVSFLEQIPSIIYPFHLMWVEYIRELLKGTIKPSPEYLDNKLETFGIVDYYASFYIIKYLADMKTISYIGKCTGVYPTALPSKEFIGSRNVNEICLLPINYNCVSYRECIPHASISWGSKPVFPQTEAEIKTWNTEENNLINHWIFGEVIQKMKIYTNDSPIITNPTTADIYYPAPFTLF